MFDRGNNPSQEDTQNSDDNNSDQGSGGSTELPEPNLGETVTKGG